MNITNYNSNIIANVSTNNQLQVINPSNITSSGNPNNTGNYGTQVCEQDAGISTGQVQQKQTDISGYYRKIQTRLNTIVYAQFGTTLSNTTISDTNNWLSSTSTMTISSGNGFTQLNANLTTSANTYAMIYSPKAINFIGNLTYVYETSFIYSSLNISNGNMFVSGFIQSFLTPISGIYFSYNPNGTLTGCVSSSFTSTYQPNTLYTKPLTIPTLNQLHKYKIIINLLNVEFWIDDILQDTINLNTMIYANVMKLSYNIVHHCRIPTLVSTTRTSAPFSIFIRNCSLTLEDVKMTKPYTHVKSELGLSSFQLADNMVSAGSTMGTALYLNTSSPTPTTFAGGSFQNQGLGGLFSVNYTSVLTTATATFSLLYYKIPNIPTGSAPYSSKNLAITGFSMHSVITTAISSSPVVPLFYSLSYGGSGATLPPNNSNTALLNIPIGFDIFRTNTVGTLGKFFYIPFKTPLICGINTAICVKIRTGANVIGGSSGVITYCIAFDGYWC